MVGTRNKKTPDTPSLNYLPCAHQERRQTQGLHFSFTAGKRAEEKVSNTVCNGSRTFDAEASLVIPSPKEKLFLYSNKGGPLSSLVPTSPDEVLLN